MSITTLTRRAFLVMGSVMLVTAVASPGAVLADQAERAAIDASADLALQQLFAENNAAQQLSEKAVALLVFPKITKAGLGIGAQAGKGVLRSNGQSVGYYRTRGLSFGAQAGAQTYGYVLMFMTENALNAFSSKKGFEVGVDGSVAIIDAGASANIDTSNIKSDTVAVVFNEAGLMYNLTIEGSKIDQLDI